MKNLPPGMPTPKAAGELPLNQIDGFPMTAILALRQRGVETLGGLCERAEKCLLGSHRDKLLVAIGPIDETVAGWAADAVLDHLHPDRVTRPHEPKPEPTMPQIEYVKPQSLQLHPEASLVPEMAPDQYKAFLKDVKDKGVIEEPLKRIKGTNTVIDGRTRRQAAIDAGFAQVPVIDADLGNESPVVYMMRVALLRRHLKPAQAAKVGNEIKKKLAAEMRQRKKEGGQKGGTASAKTRRGEPETKLAVDLPQASAGRKTRAPGAREQAAAMAGTTAKAIDTAAKIEAKAPEVYAKMGTGEIPTLAAAKKAAKIETPKAKEKPPDEPTAEEKICSLLHDLTPCPFCGAPDDHLWVASGHTEHKVGCHDCGTMGPAKSSAVAARASWNKRAAK